MKKERARLKTKYTVGDIPFDAYPRPTMVRDSYLCLNGKWRITTPDWSGEIVVPYPPESMLSGIGRHIGNRYTYEREFCLPDGFLKDRVILHFGAIDQIARVYLNGKKIGEHVGGYTPFSIDVSSFLSNLNTLTVEVEDNLSDHVLPYGKQSKVSKGMWYTSHSGIWQTVWLESLPKRYIKHLEVEIKDGVKITAEGVKEGAVTVNTPGGKLSKRLIDGVVVFKLENPRLWSPEDPYLYRYTVESGEDKVESYFAIRNLTTNKIDGIPRLCLNGKPYFFHGILDQGYWSDGLVLPANADGYRDDILRLKSLGFNMLRKHVKIEPQIFYALCDELGIVVFQDMVNNGEYKFARDTLLPNIGLKRRECTRAHRCIRTREAFIKQMKETVSALKVHPCIVYWTIFNEGWGQFEADKAYQILKDLDDTRFIDSTSGWFETKLSDVKSIHSYFFPPRIKVQDKPVVLSEFGGSTYFVDGHSAVLKRYGYGTAKTREKFVEAVRSKYEKIIEWKKKGLCASVYTQLSDVEDEINGLTTFDRAVDKIISLELIDLSTKLTGDDYEIQ